MTDTTETTIREEVRARYAKTALSVVSGESREGPCCGGGGCGPSSSDPISSNLYDAVQQAELPDTAVLASLGCGNPTALAELSPGEVVLDLGSGGGIDVLLSAKRVGPTGKAYGLDMTDEMLNLARANQAKAGVTNVEFLQGHIEEIPLPDESVDVIISNCVINLSGDKAKVLREAFRVLKPGGRFAVSDVITRGEVPEAIKRSMELWVGCIAGALEEREFERLLAAAGFEAISFEPTRIYQADDAREFLVGSGLDPDVVAAEVDGSIPLRLRARQEAHRMSTVTRTGDGVMLRKATPSDLPAVLELLEQAGLPRDGLSDGLVHLCVAELDGELAGVAGLERYGTSALLRSVAVSPTQRRASSGPAAGRSAPAGGALRTQVHDVYLRTTTAEEYFPKFGFASRGGGGGPGCGA